MGAATKCKACGKVLRRGEVALRSSLKKVPSVCSYYCIYTLTETKKWSKKGLELLLKVKNPTDYFNLKFLENTGKTAEFDENELDLPYKKGVMNEKNKT